MRSSKGSHRIVVNEVEYRWRATGNDGYITVGIWPSSNIGSFIHGNFKYHETGGDQIVITNRIVRRVIEYVLSECSYDPNVKSNEINLKNMDYLIQWDDAVRARKPQK